MGQHEPTALSRTAAAQAAAPGGKLLELQTAGAANRAYLQQDGNSRVFLYFRGLRFGVDDYVPNSLAGGRAAWAGGTAGQFTCRQMLARHGRDEDAWPALARQFLLQHARSHAGTRALAQRAPMPARREPMAAKRAMNWRGTRLHFRLAHLFSQAMLSAS